MIEVRSAATAQAGTGTPLLEIRDLTVKFPGVVALDSVSFDLLPGECHALVGENGAGKSTLAKVIIGENQPASGRMFVEGHEVNLHSYSVRGSQRLGFAIVHQEFQLIDEMTALENIFVGHYSKVGPFIDRVALRRRAHELMELLGLEIDLSRPVKYLRTAEKQVVQLARAMALDAKVVILDELTAVLPESDIQAVFRLVRTLTERGIGVIYISHRLDEIFEICDRYTVLRDGHGIATANVRDLTKAKIVRMIAGRELTKVFPDIGSPGEEVLLETRALSSKAFRKVSLSVRKGEVVGIAGLVGAGKTELLHALFGNYPLTGGEILVRGKPVRIASPQAAIKHGLGLIPDERKRQGLNTMMDVRKNTTLPAMRDYKKALFFMDEKRELTAAYGILEQLQLRYRSLWQGVGKLSGGNQQKIVLAKWMLAHTDVFLMDEPTRGIDVGAKAEIYRLIAELTARGKAVVLVSPELEELLGLANRIYIMYEGKIKDMVEGDRKDQATIMTSLLGANE